MLAKPPRNLIARKYVPFNASATKPSASKKLLFPDPFRPTKTVNARDRIGKGPWQNFKGTVIATSVADLHSDNNKLGQAN